MTLVIPSVGCVSAKSSDRAPVCTGCSFSCKSVVLPGPQLPGTHRREPPWGSLFAPWAADPIRVGVPGASWAQIPLCQCLIWCSWPFRLASKAHLGVKFPLGSARSGALGCADWLPRRILASNVPFAVTLWRRSVVACAIFGQHASKDDSGIEQSASEQLSSARRLCEAP